MRVSKASQRLAILLALCTGDPLAAWAQAPAPQTDVGPGRVTCTGPKACVLEIGSPVSLRYKIDPTALGTEDKDRLTKRCTPKAPPCVATVTGTDSQAGVKAAKIKFYN